MLKDNYFIFRNDLSVVTEITFSPVTAYDRGPWDCAGYDLKGSPVGSAGKLKLKIRGKQSAFPFYDLNRCLTKTAVGFVRGKGQHLPCMI